MIPKIIHHIWPGPAEIPAVVLQYMETWRACHPDWEFRLWTRDHLPSLQNAGIYEHSFNVAQRVNILRQEVLLQFGGLYVDSDFECLRSLTPFLELTDYFFGTEQPGAASPAILGAIPGHPLTQHCVRNLARAWPWQSDLSAETGTAFFQTAIREYLQEHTSTPATDPVSGRSLGRHLAPHTGAPDLLALDPWVLHPHRLNGRWQRDSSDAYTLRHWPGSTTSTPTLQDFRDSTHAPQWVTPEPIGSDMEVVHALVRSLRHAEGEILDCGARIGAFSCLLASWGVRQNITSFEPEPNHFELLQRNTRRFQKVTPIRKGVGTREERRVLASQGETGGGPVRPQEAAEGISNEVIDLYRYIRRVGTVALLRLDLRGDEAEVLNRMPLDILRRIHILIIEQQPSATDPEAALDHERLKRAGFALWLRPFGSPHPLVLRADKPWAEGKAYLHPPSPKDRKLLAICDVEGLGRRMDKAQFYMYEALGQRPSVTLTGPGCDGFERGMDVRQLLDRHGKPDFIFHGVDLAVSNEPLVRGLEDVEVKKAMELIDTHASPEVQQSFLRKYRFDYAFHCPQPWLGKYELYCPDTKFVWTPHGVNTRIYRDHGLSKDVDILFYGAVSEQYPLRMRLLLLLSRMAQNTALRIKIVEHPGYWDEGYAPQPTHIVGEDLAKWINRSWLTVATPSRYSCFYSKHLEVPACGSVTVGGVPAQARPFLGDAFIDLSEMDDTRIEARLFELLEDKEDLARRAREGHERISSAFSLESYADNMLELVDQLLGPGRSER